MKKLLELEEKLKKAREELEKNMMMGYGGNSPTTGMPAGTADVNMAKEEDCEEKIDEKMDEHNEEKHGEAKDEDSAKKSDIPKEITDQTAGEIIADQEKPKPMEKSETLTFNPGGQWSLEKAIVMDQKPDGEFDVPVKEVYDGDDEFVHVGNRGVDGDDKGKTEKLADKEQRMLKD